MRKFTNVAEAIEYEVQDWLKCGESGNMSMDVARAVANDAKVALEQMCSECDIVEVRFFEEDWEDGESRGIAINKNGDVVLFGYNGACSHVRMYHVVVTDAEEKAYLLEHGNPSCVF